MGLMLIEGKMGDTRERKKGAVYDKECNWFFLEYSRRQISGADIVRVIYLCDKAH